MTNQPSSPPALHPSASRVCQPSAPPALQPSASRACQPSGPPALQPSASRVCQPSGPPALQPSASRVCQPSGPPALHPSASRVCQPSGPPALHPSASRACQPSSPPALQPSFFHGKKIFVTGHTGFKGSWLCLWLSSLGADITGYALDPPTQPSLFELARVGEVLARDIRADVRDLPRLSAEMVQAAPEIVFHLAAQPLVRESYRIPVETFATNVMGTVHLLEAVRSCPSVRAVVNVTTDKCYENRERSGGYRENEPMGGYDPYSSSKGCSELVTAAYRRSFFGGAEGQRDGGLEGQRDRGTDGWRDRGSASPPTLQPSNPPAVATARAGNVIGGGDWATDRLIPDCIRALLAGEEILIRSPQAIRPWQHVLEPLSGYLFLAERLYNGGSEFAGPWNFGPTDEDARPVEWIVQNLCSLWGGGAGYRIDGGSHPHEAHCLKLDISKARGELRWTPQWNLEQALGEIIEWTQAMVRQEDMRVVTLKQIAEYQQKVCR